MFEKIVHAALRFRGVVMALAILLLAYGVYSVTQARYDVFPEFVPPHVTVQTQAPGLSPRQVEKQVTTPLELAVNGLPHVKLLRSISVEGLSVVKVLFHQGESVYRARDLVAQRIGTVALPPGVRPATMTPLTSSTSVVLYVGLTAKHLSLTRLRTIADYTVRPRILATAGVAKVAVYGGMVRQWQIQLRPRTLERYGLNIHQVLHAARRATGVAGAGFIDTANQRIVLRSEGQARTPAALGRVVLLYRHGRALTLGQVATVKAAHAPPSSLAQIMGKPGISLMVSSQYHVNTLNVTRRLLAALRSLKPALQRQGVHVYTDIFRPADFITTAVGNLRSSLLVGAVLIVVVLFLFLFNLRTAAISCTAIPLSLLAAVIVLTHLGYNLNTMTLGGLAIALGEVVDDAVIDVENILRRLLENRHLPQPRNALAVVLDASLEVRGAVVYATLAVLLVFLPVLSLGGVAGRLFAPMGLAYIAAVLASLLVALTVTPAMCLVLLRGYRPRHAEPPVVYILKRFYVRILRLVEKAPWLVIGIAALVTVGGLLPAMALRATFLPRFNEGYYTVHLALMPGTSLQQSIAMGDRITAALLKLPEVRSVAQRAGMAKFGNDVLGPQHSECQVQLKPMTQGQLERFRKVLRTTLAKFPGTVTSFNSFLTERIDETMTGYHSAVVVTIVGTKLRTLDSLAARVAGALRSVPGAASVKMKSIPQTPHLIVRLRPRALARWGFRPLTVLRAVQTAYAGRQVGQIYYHERVIPVVVILKGAARHEPQAVGRLPLRSPDGVYVPLRKLARIGERSGRYSVLHQASQRVQVITCNVAGRSVSGFVAAARKKVAAAVPFPPGYYAAFSGTARAQAKSFHQLLVYSGVAAAGILLLLAVALRGARNVVLVVLNLPLALVGGVLAVYATGGVVSLGSMVGFITLFGITLRNAIMLISHYDHLVVVEKQPWNMETALRGASERLAPILMTALVTGLGLLPLAWTSGSPGREVEGPMAQVILGGLFTSTFLNLLVLPALSLRFGRFGVTAEAPVAA